MKEACYMRSREQTRDILTPAKPFNDSALMPSSAVFRWRSNSGCVHRPRRPTRRCASIPSARISRGAAKQLLYSFFHQHARTEDDLDWSRRRFRDIYEFFQIDTPAPRTKVARSMSTLPLDASIFKSSGFSKIVMLLAGFSKKRRAVAMSGFSALARPRSDP